jgi:hypothetical protein
MVTLPAPAPHHSRRTFLYGPGPDRPLAVPRTWPRATLTLRDALDRAIERRPSRSIGTASYPSRRRPLQLPEKLCQAYPIAGRFGAHTPPFQQTDLNITRRLEMRTLQVPERTSRWLGPRE